MTISAENSDVQDVATAGELYYDTSSVELNMDPYAVFARMPAALAARLRAGGAVFYDWGVPQDGHVLARLMLSFATPEDDVARLIALAK